MAVAFWTSRSRAWRRASSRSWVYSWISPPTIERRPAITFPPSPRLRTTTPKHCPSVCTVRWPATFSVVATIIGDPSSYRAALAATLFRDPNADEPARRALLCSLALRLVRSRRRQIRGRPANRDDRVVDDRLDLGTRHAGARADRKRMDGRRGQAGQAA